MFSRVVRSIQTPVSSLQAYFSTGPKTGANFAYKGVNSASKSNGSGSTNRSTGTAKPTSQTPRNNGSVKVRPDQYSKTSNPRPSVAREEGAYRNPANKSTPMGQVQENSENLFDKSRLNNKFNAPHDGLSYFRRLVDKTDVVYFSGTRRVTSSDDTINDASYVFLMRSVDKAQKLILDRLIAFDYNSGMPFEQEMNTLVDDSLDKAITVDMDPESDRLVSRTLIKLRGDPWAWHSALSITRLERDDENFPDRPEDTMTISRVRFDAEGMLAEKIIRQNNETLYTVVDDLKVITPKVFAEKTKRIYDEYSKMMEQQIENAADEFGTDRAEQITKMAGVEDFKPNTKRK